jgi:hypothetical protein
VSEPRNKRCGKPACAYDGTKGRTDLCVAVTVSVMVVVRWTWIVPPAMVLDWGCLALRLGGRKAERERRAGAPPLCACVCVCVCVRVCECVSV